MNKILLLKLCIIINLIFLGIFILSFFIFNSNVSNYFRIGWSDNFVFVSTTIDTPFKYLALCTFIIVLNMTEIFLNDIACPIIQFSTYNPYKIKITDFSRFELEIYSNLVFFILTTKRLLQVIVTLSQIDIAFVSLISSQLSAYMAINYLLDQKSFEKECYETIPNERVGYHAINENTRLQTIYEHV